MSHSKPVREDRAWIWTGMSPARKSTSFPYHYSASSKYHSICGRDSCHKFITSGSSFVESYFFWVFSSKFLRWSVAFTEFKLCSRGILALQSPVDDLIIFLFIIALYDILCHSLLSSQEKNWACMTQSRQKSRQILWSINIKRIMIHCTA